MSDSEINEETRNKINECNAMIELARNAQEKKANAEADALLAELAFEEELEKNKQNKKTKKKAKKKEKKQLAKQQEEDERKKAEEEEQKLLEKEEKARLAKEAEEKKKQEKLKKEAEEQRKKKEADLQALKEAQRKAEIQAQLEEDMRIAREMAERESSDTCPSYNSFVTNSEKSSSSEFQQVVSKKERNKRKTKQVSNFPSVSHVKRNTSEEEFGVVQEKEGEVYVMDNEGKMTLLMPAPQDVRSFFRK